MDCKPCIFIIASLMFLLIDSSVGLECYECVNQDGNTEKCLNTIRPCEQGEEVCMTEVKWGTMPYWQQGGKKQYYVSKQCATKQICERARSRSMRYCTYIWYEDWRCVHCCQGERCNYYAILGASSTQVNVVVLSFSTAVAVIWRIVSS